MYQPLHTPSPKNKLGWRFLKGQYCTLVGLPAISADSLLGKALLPCSVATTGCTVINVDEWVGSLSLFRAGLNRRFPLSLSMYPIYQSDRVEASHTPPPPSIPEFIRLGGKHRQRREKRNATKARNPDALNYSGSYIRGVKAREATLAFLQGSQRNSSLFLLHNVCFFNFYLNFVFERWKCR